MAAQSALFFSVSLICGFAAGEILPQVQPQADVMPFLVRADGTGARSRSCFNGTEFIVTFSDGVNHMDAASIMNDRISSNTVNHCRTLRHSEVTEGQLNAMSICIPPEQDVDAHLLVLLAMEGVEAVEENLPVNIFPATEEKLIADTMGWVPWHLDRIDQPTLPLDGQYYPGSTGQGVRVYLTDTGADASHPEFEGRVQAGFSAVYGQQATIDMGNHGTHTAGIVGSRDYGVAKEVTIIPVKVFSDNGGGASSADIIEGINWIISQEQYFVGSAALSMSLGMPSSSFYAGDQALLRAAQANIIPVVAAGNDATDACGYWPAHSTSAITVGATDIEDYRSSFSNYGSCVDIYAPGTSITSTLPNDRIGVMSGTSMACPVVSGTVALHLERYPTATLQEVRDALIRNAVGQHNVVLASRMLLVQVKERTQWGLMASNEAAMPVSDALPTALPVQWALPLGIGCITALIAALLAVHNRVRKSALAPLSTLSCL